MAQLFRPRSNTIYRVLLLGIPVATVGVLLLSTAWTHSSYETEKDIFVDQPVPFSHKHHVGGLGIDCRYCHSSVETSAYAGMPSTHTCMSCHSQIWSSAPMLEPVRRSERTGVPLRWNRVYRVPRHVYFNHSAHVGQGIQCASCHGQLDRMPLVRKHRTFLMRDCLSCHRENPTKLPHPERLQDCDTCHR